MYKPVVLVIIDGWGISNATQGNPIKEANLPTFSKLEKYYPMIALQASGISVGLPWRECGNSEVGHITLGAGKIIYQNMPRITLAIQDGTFFNNEVLNAAMENVKTNKSDLHIMGLVGRGAVHSYAEHLYALVEMAAKNKIKNIYLHAFTDGRDSAPYDFAKYWPELKERLDAYGGIKLASICGRNWAMDRNNNWDRTEKAYKMLVEGGAEQTDDPIIYLNQCYEKECTDEYVEPTNITEDGKPVALIKDNDSVVFFNFREDRARQLTKAFALPGFENFNRGEKLNIQFITMTEYEKDLPVFVAFPPEETKNGLGETISKANRSQLRIAETEKYAHVTYFFNGGQENPWPGEDRVLIPSPSVSTYDLSPEMSAAEVTEKIIKEVDNDTYDFILVNYANADMVGHTGKRDACIKALQSLDKSMEKLIPAVLNQDGCILITADHGNVEEIINFQTGEADTEHSSNPVPFWFITKDNHAQKDEIQIMKEKTEIKGLLSDVAPTILDLMDLQKPADMTGDSLKSMLS